MTFMIRIGSFIFRNTGITRITSKRRGSSTESEEVVWPKPKKQPVKIMSKEAKVAENEYLNSKITLVELQEVRRKHPPTTRP